MIEPRTELEAAALVASGDLSSPYFYLGSELFAVRVTGLGCAYRAALNELVWREKRYWASEEGLRRCIGLLTVIGHPASGVLNGKELAERIIGVIIFSYMRGDEVWGVMRVLNHDAAAALVDTEYDSSPSVVFTKDSGNVTIDLPDGQKLLCESRPALIDHLAIVPKGTWTRKGDVPGVEISPEVKELENA